MNFIMTNMLAFLIAIIYPIYIFATHQKVNANIIQNEKYRLLDYKQTLLIFWGLTLLIFLNFFVYKQPDLNFNLKLSIINTGLIILILVLTYLQYKTSNITPKDSNSVKEKLKGIYHYLPKTRNELIWFSLLSISAGICEEIIFRLFFFEFLKEHTTLIITFIVTNLIFAITHIGTGKRNLISSFFLGVLFSVLYYFTDNIWIAVLLHSLINLNAGLLGFRINKIEKSESELSPNR